MSKILETTSMSSKGQLVIPNNIRSKLHLLTGTKFIILTDGNNILLKPIEIPKNEEFEELIIKSKKYQKYNKIKQKDLNQAIKKVRSKK